MHIICLFVYLFTLNYLHVVVNVCFALKSVSMGVLRFAVCFSSRLRGSRVLLVGLGGLGAEVAKNLILAGVKGLTMLDHEQVHTQMVTFITLLQFKNYFIQRTQ